MGKKSEGILFLVLLVVLLVVISSRTAPLRGSGISAPAVTDDPIPETTPLRKSAEKAGDSVPETPEVTETPVQELLPGVSAGDWNLRLVNNTYVLSASYAPNVVKVRDEQYFSTEAAEALEAMLAAAEAEGYTVCLRSAYRPFSTQAYIFNGRSSQIQWGTSMTLMEAETEARKVVAYPGTSEHQLGLAADIMDAADTPMAADTAAELPVLQWLQAHCTEYGFILRYPEEKQAITGWYEPWHFRYVGEECAEFITDRGLCLEEFVDLF